MLRYLILICLIFESLSLKYGTDSRNPKFDPDVDICNDPTLNGGVVADDGETYLFKGNYFWRTRPLTRDTGIVGFANLTTSKWPEVTGAIRLVFTIPKNDSLMTVFVGKTKWLGFQYGLKVMEGVVDSWPDFKSLQTTAAFTPTFAGTLVYILYSDNNYYILYDFANMSKPKKVRSGPTTIRENYLVFTGDSAKAMPGTSVRSLVDVRAGLTYKNKLYLMSRDTYCVVELSASSYEKECKPRNVNEVLGCPLDISKRPASKPENPEKTTSSKTTASMGATSMPTPSTSKTLISNVTLLEPIPSNWDIDSSTDSDGEIKTGIPILGRPLVEEEDNHGNTTSLTAPGMEEKKKGEEKNKDKSLVWFIGFMVVLTVISLLFILMAGMVSRVRNKKRGKGSVVFIK